MIARAMRRTNGPLWAVETTLITFTMWRRYAAVRACYREERPALRFSHPNIPEWTKLLQRIALHEARKKRARDSATMLHLKFSWKQWRYAMTLDRSLVSEGLLSHPL
jgi:hypothetical protein